MIRKIVKKHDLDNFSEIGQNLEYWLSRPPEERLAAVDTLRREYYGDSQRLQRVARVIGREDFITNKKATGKKKDVVDIEALGQ
jgi:hypothetical protein